MGNETKIETERFREAVRGQNWGKAADMVRKYAEDQGHRDINSDALADWLAEGEWDGTETPESVAAEWDAA